MNGADINDELKDVAIAKWIQEGLVVLDCQHVEDMEMWDGGWEERKNWGARSDVTRAIRLCVRGNLVIEVQSMNRTTF